jgi:cobalt-zinc-cadmium efflux system outer membrane protein
MGAQFNRTGVLIIIAAVGWVARAGAQRPVTRGEVVDAAVTVGPRLAVAKADTEVALAALISASSLPDPTLSASYTKDLPSYHTTVEWPIDFPWLRAPRVGSARAARTAAQFNYTFQRAAAALDADTTYTRALAAREHARLSRRNATDADSLRRMAATRRDAGDASDLDVELATVNAGQQANVAAADSLSYLSTLLDVQAVMGIVETQATILPSDSLGYPSVTDGDGDVTINTTLEVAAAEQTFNAARLAATFQRRVAWSGISLTAGYDWGDPTNPGLLPVVGLTVPIALFSRHRGQSLEAEATLEKTRAELALARTEGAARIARARREQNIALAKVTRDRVLLASADRVASMSLTAYREGQSSLPNVLEAQRNARDILGQYIDDLAAAWIASASLRVFLLTTASVRQ